ncbi:ribonuclease HI family protein [bacterium]|nr:ribonuclease HI family protein [bacterium]
MNLICYIDGASKGNPGPAGIGVFITTESGDELIRMSKSIGIATNNVAEYKALILALEQVNKLIHLADVTHLPVLTHPTEHNIEIRSDSELLVKQMRGEYRLKNPTLAQLAAKAHKLLQFGDVAHLGDVTHLGDITHLGDVTHPKIFRTVKFVHILRKYNKIADGLANIGVSLEKSEK